MNLIKKVKNEKMLKWNGMEWLHLKDIFAAMYRALFEIFYAI